MIGIKKILREEWDDAEYNAAETYMQYKDDAMNELIYDILHNPKSVQTFNLASYERINKIWAEYSKNGFVRDEAGIKEIGNIFIRNIAMLAVNTELAGHTPYNPEATLRDFDERLTTRQIKKILGNGLERYIRDYNGQYRISDYGLPKLEKLAWKYLTQDKTAEQKLLTLDMILNVVHQRSDLSRLFVQGGSASLDKLFTNENTMKDLVKSKLDELLKLKRFKTPATNNEPEKEDLVVVSDLPDPKQASAETFVNKDAIKKDNLFRWDKFKKMWVADVSNFKQAQERLNTINKKEELISKLEDVAQLVASDDTIMDEGQIESRITMYIEDLANATDEKAADAAIRRYLTFQAKFHSYSFTNVLLILIQKPDATKVAGKGDWKTKHKRYVVAGAKPIWIFAPLIRGGKAGEVDTEGGGDTEMDRMAQAGRLVGYKAVQVFDISDTKPFDPTAGGPEGGGNVETPEWFLSTPPTELTERLFNYVSEVVKQENINLTTTAPHGRERGYSAGGHINMTSDVKGAGEVSTLVHELAHELMHWPKSKFYQGDELKRNKAIMELQAESVSYVVMKHYGLPVEHHSTYISLWKGNKKEILNNMSTIQKVAKYIILKIDEVAEGDTITEDLYL